MFKCIMLHVIKLRIQRGGMPPELSGWTLIKVSKGRFTRHTKEKVI
jgi:hypothetical protein